jgi:hypothetical protein
MKYSIFDVRNEIYTVGRIFNIVDIEGIIEGKNLILKQFSIERLESNIFCKMLFNIYDMSSEIKLYTLEGYRLYNNIFINDQKFVVSQLKIEWVPSVENYAPHNALLSSRLIGYSHFHDKDGFTLTFVPESEEVFFNIEEKESYNRYEILDL